MSLTERHVRQLAALGRKGQRRLAESVVAVVGCGGAGSLAVQALAHLGVGHVVLVDDDVVEASNLNRLVGAMPIDARLRRRKTSVAERLVRRVDPDIAVTELRGSVLEPDVWRQLRGVDALVGAVDTDAARWALNLLAVQYQRCYVDVGVSVIAEARVEAAGHVAVVLPGGPCLRCLHGYDPRAAARELQPQLEAAQRAVGYLPAELDEPAPNVVFLNQVVVGVAVGGAIVKSCG